MFNFPQSMPLGYLTQDEINLVIIQPFETLGIILIEQENLLQAIWALTSGHPNLTQYVGKALVDEANHRQVHEVFPIDVEKIRNSTSFSDFFFETIWGAANSMEKLVTLVAPTEKFRVGEVEKSLGNYGISIDTTAIDDALKMLVIYSVFNQDGRFYQFAPKVFTELRDRNLEVDRLIDKERKKLTISGVVK
jgi:hypothetical protein